MADRLWDRLLSYEHTNLLWEMFHENSKITRYSEFLPDEEVRRRMQGIWQSLPMAHMPPITLPVPETGAPSLALGFAISRRRSPNNMVAAPLAQTELGALLYYMAAARSGSGEPERPFRMVPSGGALYPIEIFVHLRTVEGLAPGLYYYDPLDHALHSVDTGDRSGDIAVCLLQPSLVMDSAIQIFQTALCVRSTFKYGDRGYRFVMMEAGHQAQNLSLVATALGLGCVHVGGYRDHAVDEFLGIDGINHSTVYLAFVGRSEDEISA